MVAHLATDSPEDLVDILVNVGYGLCIALFFSFKYSLKYVFYVQGVMDSGAGISVAWYKKEPM